MLVVQAERGVAQSPLVAKIGRKARRLLCERIADRVAPWPTDKSGNHDPQHLLDRDARVTGDRRHRGPTRTTSLEPKLQEGLHMGWQLLIALRSVRLRKRSELP